MALSDATCPLSPGEINSAMGWLKGRATEAPPMERAEAMRIEVLLDWFSVRLAASTGEAREVCRWSYMDWPESDSDFEGDCGIAWSMIDGGLEQNGMVFCPRCGGRIDFVPPVDDDGEQDDEDIPAPAPTEGREG